MNSLFMTIISLLSFVPIQETAIENLSDYYIFVEQDDNTSMVSLTDLFTDAEKFRNKTIIVKGKVVKINPNILGKNWIHIQDGTKDDDGEFHDLTITSEEIFEVDDEIVIKGKIILDKNFGAGYIYDVIMEEAESYKKRI
ncbi:MAG: hypothetical protein HKN68_10900 [Saprospiraceae bacterium]|nr:hypothetical protein [Saprospiraceae bacterium]